MADQSSGGGGGGVLGILLIVGGLGGLLYADMQTGFLPIPGLIAPKPKAPQATVNISPSGVSSASLQTYLTNVESGYAITQQYLGKPYNDQAHQEALGYYNNAALAIGGKVVYDQSSGVTQILNAQKQVVFQT